MKLLLIIYYYYYYSFGNILSFKLYLVYLYFASPKPAVLLVEGIRAKLTCTVSVYQNQSVAYIISGPPPAPGCLPEWTAAVSTTRLFFSLEACTVLPYFCAKWKE